MIDYITARMLQREGLKGEQIRTVAVPKMDQRLALLGSGELKAATLPEPFGTIAMSNGAVVILEDAKYPEYGNSVISFRKEFIDQHPGAVKGFLQAVEQAVAAINKNGDSYRSLLSEYKLIPQSIQDSYPIPSFPVASWPSKAQFDDAVIWAKQRGMVPNDISYEQSVTNEYLIP